MRKFPIVRSALALGLALAGCAHPAGPVRSAAAGATPVPTADAAREQTADQQVKHVLNRLAFGARPGDVERVRAVGVDRWIAQQLDPARVDDAAMDGFLARYPTLRMRSDEIARDYPPPQQFLQQQRRELARAGMSPNDSAANKRGEFLLTRADSAQYRQVQQRAQRVVAEIQIARVARAVASERQLQEVMVDFWLNHFNVYAAKGPTRYLLQEYEREAIRPNALGKFRDLLGAVAKSPAMLFYLDNWESMADSSRPTLVSVAGARNRERGAGRRIQPPARPGRPGAIGRRQPQPLPAPGSPLPPPPQRRARGLNENYGRELLELHTLGVDGGYTQAGVIDVARALTGWTIQNPRGGGGFVFRPFMHDAGAKTVLGHKLPAGRGIEDGEAVLDIVARHPATARFIATKLVRRFVSDSPPPALVARAAATFTRSDGDLREVVRTIVTSPEFFSAEAYRGKVKSPFELVVSALRAVGAQPDSTPRTAQLVARLGEPLFGHQAPNGYPETGDAWINTGAILNRINFGLALAAGRIPGVSLAGWSQAAALRQRPQAEQVDGVIAALLGGEASPETRQILESGENPFLQRPQSPDSTAMRVGGDTSMVAEMRPPQPPGPPAAGAAPPTPGEGPLFTGRMGGRDPLTRPTNLRGFAQLVGLALGAPEFQRR